MSFLSYPPSLQGGYAAYPEESEFPELWDGLQAAWVPALGYQGNRVYDFGPFRMHGTLTNMNPVADWVLDASHPDLPIGLRFTPTDDKVVIPDPGTNSPVDFPSNSEFGIVIWCKPAVTNGTMHIATKFTANSHAANWGIQHGINDARFLWSYGMSGGTLHEYSIPNVYQANVLNCTAMSWVFTQPSTLRVWINGVDRTSQGTWIEGNGTGAPAITNAAVWLGNADDGTAGPDNYPYNGIIFAVFLYRRRLTDYDIGVFNRYPLAPLMLRSPSVLGRMVVISTDLGVSSDSPLFAVYGQRHSHSLGTTSHDTPAFRLAASSPFPMLSAVADLIARSFPVPIISVPHGIQTSSDYRAQLLLRPVDTQSGQASMSLPAPVWRVVSSVPLEVAGGETRTLRLSGASAFPMALAVDAASGAFLRTAHSLGLVQSVSSIHEATVRAVYSAAMPAVVGALTPAMLQVLVGAFPFASAQSIVAAASSSAALSLPHQTTGDLGASAQLSERFSLPHQTTGDLGASAGLAEHLSLLAGTQLSSSHALSMSERSSILLDHSTAIAPGAALTMALSGSFTSQAALIVDVTVEETIAHVLVLLGCHAALSPLHSVAQVYSAAFVADAMAASLIFARPQIQAHPGGVSAAIAQVVSVVHTIQGLLAVQTDLSPALLARLSSAFSEFAAATMSLSAAVGERVALSLSGAVGEGSKVASSLAGTLVLATGTALEPAVREAIVQHLTAVVQSALSESERHILRQAEALGVSADQAQSIARLAVLFAAASVQTTLQSLAFGILPNVPSMLRVVQERVLQGVIGEEAVRRAGLAHEAVRRAGMVDEEPQG